MAATSLAAMTHAKTQASDSIGFKDSRKSTLDNDTNPQLCLIHAASLLSYHQLQFQRCAELGAGENEQGNCATANAPLVPPPSIVESGSSKPIV